MEPSQPSTLTHRLSFASAALVVLVWPVLSVAHLLVRFFSFQFLEQLLARVPTILHLSGSRAREWPLAIGYAVHRARRLHVTDVKCLAAAATCTSLLRLVGLPATLVIGVRRDPFEAHAWTELEGGVVGERREHVAQYTPMHRLEQITRLP